MTASATGTYATAAAVKTRLGITDTTDDTLIQSICDQVNQYIETTTRRILAPITSATYTYDGDGCNRLFLPITADGTPIGGIRAITLLELSRYTGAAYDTVASSQYFLRGKSLPTAPFDWLYLTDLPVLSGYTAFAQGFATVRITGTAGWAAIPDDITEVALDTAVNAWKGRQSGQQSIVGNDAFGAPEVTRYVSAKDRNTLRKYQFGSDLA